MKAPMTLTTLRDLPNPSSLLVSTIWSKRENGPSCRQPNMRGTSNWKRSSRKA